MAHHFGPVHHSGGADHAMVAVMAMMPVVGTVVVTVPIVVPVACPVHPHVVRPIVDPGVNLADAAVGILIVCKPSAAGAGVAVGNNWTWRCQDSSGFLNHLSPIVRAGVRVATADQHAGQNHNCQDHVLHGKSPIPI